MAHIIPCNTAGRDAALEPTFYTTTTAPVVVDLQAISAVVGRVKTRDRWGIIDRSDGKARTVFVDPPEDE